MALCLYKASVYRSTTGRLMMLDIYTWIAGIYIEGVDPNKSLTTIERDGNIRRGSKTNRPIPGGLMNRNVIDIVCQPKGKREKSVVHPQNADRLSACVSPVKKESNGGGELIVYNRYAPPLAPVPPKWEKKIREEQIFFPLYRYWPVERPPFEWQMKWLSYLSSFLYSLKKSRCGPFFLWLFTHTQREYLTFSFLSPLAKNVPPFFIFDFFQVFQQHGAPHSNIHKRKKGVFAGRGADGSSGGIVICHCRMCPVLSACRAQFPNTLPSFSDVLFFFRHEHGEFPFLFFCYSVEEFFSGHLANSSLLTYSSYTDEKNTPNWNNEDDLISKWVQRNLFFDEMTTSVVVQHVTCHSSGSKNATRKNKTQKQMIKYISRWKSSHQICQ